MGVIPAAGRGVRFRELGRVYPKAMLPYREVPIIVHTIKWMKRQECHPIVVVTGHRSAKIKRAVSDYFDDTGEILFATQEELSGLSGAVLAALDRAAGEAELDRGVLVALGDLVPEGDPEFGDFNWVSVQRVPDFSRWCMVKAQERSRAVDFFDKPRERPDTDLALSGVYFFRDFDEVRSLLREQVAGEGEKIAGEYQLSSVLKRLANDESGPGVRVSASPRVVDFGTLQEFLDNRGVKDGRAFNTVVVDGPFVHKDSLESPQKIIDEINWFDRLPDALAVYTPRLFERRVFGGGELRNSSGYTMEKVHAPTLRELFLFLDASEETWSVIFDSIEDFLELARSFGRKNSFLSRMLEKTQKRIDRLEVRVEPAFISRFMRRFERLVLDAETTADEWSAVIHGDFCFSNVFFDPTTKRIVLVDPRGSLFGDQRYELAKLNHSARYGYDFIDAELYRRTPGGVVVYDDEKAAVGDLFEARFLDGLSAIDREIVEALTASLFLSMIPLHSHNARNQELYYEKFRSIVKEHGWA